MPKDNTVKLNRKCTKYTSNLACTCGNCEFEPKPWSETMTNEQLAIADEAMNGKKPMSKLDELDKVRMEVACKIGLSASTAGLAPKDLAKDEDWKEAVEKIKSSEREALEKTIKESVGYGKFGFSNEKGEICVKLSDLLSTLNNQK